MSTTPFHSRAIGRRGLRMATTSLAAAAAVGTGALTWSVTHAAATNSAGAVTADGSSSTSGTGSSTTGPSGSGTSSSGLGSLSGNIGPADASSGGS